MTSPNTIDISTMSSDELIDHYIVLLSKQAEDMKAGEVDYPHANLLALLHMARSLYQIEFRFYHIDNALESISASLKNE